MSLADQAKAQAWGDLVELEFDDIAGFYNLEEDNDET